MNEKRVEARVRGTVQGVGFRAFTLREARALSLTGYVKNEYDGSVSVVAEGPRDALERLLQALRGGPRAAAVKEVEMSWSEAVGEFTGFGVSY